MPGPPQQTSADFNPPDRQLLGLLSMILGDLQIEQLHSLFASRSTEHILTLVRDCRRTSTPLPASTHSSLNSIFSQVSHASSQSNRSHLHASGSSPKYSDFDNNTALQNQDSPFPAIPGHDCVACRVPCKNQVTLVKHQKEICERTTEWICQSCAPQKSFTAGLLERLQRHHLDVHGGVCENGCPKKGNLVDLSEPCKLKLSTSFKQVPEKRAWGCPCCLKCFQTFQEWTKHAEAHPMQIGGIENWAWRTMIRSLLSNPHLSQAGSHYNWQLCTWSSLKKEGRTNLRFALERWTLPPYVTDHQDYAHLDTPDALALYAFRLGTIGQAFPGTPLSTTSSPFVPPDVATTTFLNQQYSTSDTEPEGHRSEQVGTRYQPHTARHDTSSGHLSASSTEIIGQPYRMMLPADGEPTSIPGTLHAPANHGFIQGIQPQLSNCSPIDEPRPLKKKKSFQKFFGNKSGKTNKSKVDTPPPLPSWSPPSHGTTQTTTDPYLYESAATSWHDTVRPSLIGPRGSPVPITIEPWRLTAQGRQDMRRSPSPSHSGQNDGSFDMDGFSQH